MLELCFKRTSTGVWRAERTRSGESGSVDDRNGTELPQELVIAFRGGPYDPGSAREGDLHRHAPDASGGAVDQDGVARSYLQIGQAGRGGLSRRGQRPGLAPVQPGGPGHELGRVGQGVVGVRAGGRGRAEDVIAEPEVRHARTKRVDDPGELVAEPLREPARHEGAEAAAAQQRVGGLKAGGPDPYSDLALARRGRLGLHQAQDFGAAVLGEHNSRNSYGRSLLQGPGRAGPAV